MTRLTRMTESILVGLFFAFIYFFTATYQFSYDSITYALTIEYRGVPPLHPYHLLACYPGKWIFSILSSLGIFTKSLFIMQKINHVAGGIAMGLFYSQMRIKFSRNESLIGAGLLGLSYGFWYEMVDAGSYALAALCVAALLLCHLRIKEIPGWALGLVHGLAITINIMFVLALIPLLFLVYFEHAEQRSRYLFMYFLWLFLSAGLPYFWGAAISAHSITGAFAWAFGPVAPSPAMSVTNNFNWNLNFINNAKYSWIGFLTSIISVGGFKINRISTAIGLILCLALAFTIFQSIRRIRAKGIYNERLLVALWLWVILMNVLEFFYAPGLTRFRIIFLPFLIYIFFDTAQSMWPRREFQLAVVIVTAFVGISNALTTILPASRPTSNASMNRAEWVNEQVGGKGALLYAGVNSLSIRNVDMAYFAPKAQARSLIGYLYSHPVDSLGPLSNSIDEILRAGKTVFFEAALYDADTQKELERAGQLAPGTIQAWLAPYRILMEINDQHNYRVFLVGLNEKR